MGCEATRSANGPQKFRAGARLRDTRRSHRGDLAAAEYTGTYSQRVAESGTRTHTAPDYREVTIWADRFWVEM
jgi:hypothetical protein